MIIFSNNNYSIISQNQRLLIITIIYRKWFCEFLYILRIYINKHKKNKIDNYIFNKIGMQFNIICL